MVSRNGFNHSKTAILRPILSFVAMVPIQRSADITNDCLYYRDFGMVIGLLLIRWPFGDPRRYLLGRK